MPAPRSYSVAFAGIVAVIIAGVALTNLRVNPFRVTPSPLSDDDYDPYRDYSQNLRTGKAGYIRSGWDVGVALVGSSRVASSLDPEHPGWGRDDVINFGASAAFLHESGAFCEYILDHQTPDLIILGIDLGDLSSEIDTRPLLDFYTSPLGRRSDLIDRELRYLVGIGTFKASLDTIANRREGERAPYTLKGKRLSDQSYPGGQLAFLAAQFDNAPVQGLGNFGDGLADGEMNLEKAALLQNLMRACRERGVRLVCMIHPTHALVFAHERVNGDPVIPFSRERRAITNYAAMINQIDLPGPEIEVWDFCGYHPINCEPLPLDGISRMRWWDDFSHYSDETGDLILSRIMGWPLGEQDFASDYGQRLSLENFEDWITKLNQDLRTYLEGPAKRDLAWRHSIMNTPPAR